MWNLNNTNKSFYRLNSRSPIHSRQNTRQNSPLTKSIYKKKKKPKKKIKYDPKNFVKFGITQKKVDYYKEIFDLFDIKKTGVLTPIDLRSALEMFNYNPRKDIIYQIISKIDKNESGGIDFRNFLRIMTDRFRPCDEDTEEDYEQVFNYFDLDKKGVIEKEDFLRVCRELNLVVREEKMKEAMEVFGDKCDFISFYKVMQEVVMREPEKFV